MNRTKVVLVCRSAIVAGGIFLLAGCSDSSKQQSAGSTVAISVAPTPDQDLTSFGGGSCKVSELRGFHARENWGAWSAKDPSTIVLAQPVSGQVKLRFTAYAMNDKSPHNLNVELGGVSKSITLETAPKTFELEYSLPQPGQQIVLSGITPKSPKDLGVGVDVRPLAVGLVRIDCAAAK